MSTINTLTEFLTQADTQFQLFDMGRQVRPLASDAFERIEQQQEPYPWPLQQHAWLGVHFFQPAESRHYLWFLKFALDERGLLIGSGPKLFMDQVVETLGYKLTGDLDEGPIIEQEIQRVDHAYLPEDLVSVGRDTETIALSKAVKYFVEHRVFLNDDRTVIFK